MTDYKYKLSIIVPLYNAEKYIAACLNSILNSDLPHDAYEIVVVDDGSKDGGAEIVRSYQSTHGNITLLAQKNQGQSVARNYGIQQCQGEYVWCVDADDMLDTSALLDVLDTIAQNPVDIIAWRLKQVKEDGTFVRFECTQPKVPHNKIISGRDAIVSGYNPSSVCALSIRKKLLVDNNCYFKVGITHQDVELTYRLFCCAKTVLFLALVPYIYILHSNSTSQSKSFEKRLKYLKDEITVILSFRHVAKKNKKDIQLSKTIFNRSQNNLLGLVMSIYEHRKEWAANGVKKELISALRQESLFPMKGPFDSFKKTSVAKLLNIWFSFCR